MDKSYAEYERIMHALVIGSVQDLETLASQVPSFPQGVDSFLGRRWITNAIGSGSKRSVMWMLAKGVDLAFVDTGFSPLHSAIDREQDDRYEVLEALLKAGAPVNTRGINGWTPAHRAAAHEDIDALKILIRYKADLNERTNIDDYATPLEEAQNLGRIKSVEFLKSLEVS